MQFKSLSLAATLAFIVASSPIINGVLPEKRVLEDFANRLLEDRRVEMEKRVLEDFANRLLNNKGVGMEKRVMEDFANRLLDG
ncbi:hypothetical protein OIDMADRAFT_48796 [Oidiodendron maius Zn]|uniref:Uncharacterized protein n=1 Tax=Oidiodendron maius (strain Zn) TaxID=913774 RepID=A0A0C3E3K8_OIDMZ|nr:hypothetical protein OIDMADRAFT_48796 [Oidiodendron maius Zn]